MLYLKTFTCNPFQQNSYLVYNDKQQAILFDAGMHNNSEEQEFKNFVSEKKLVLEQFILTHAHIDHILGNKFILDTYGLLPSLHKTELFFIDKLMDSARIYGVNCSPSPQPINFINENEIIKLGNYEFKAIHTPGHSPGSLSFFNKENKLLISGDVLFNGSIGRSDLPMGNHETLINSIKNKLLVLPDETKVYSGHGLATTIGQEKISNPFLI